MVIFEERLFSFIIEYISVLFNTIDMWTSNL